MPRSTLKSRDLLREHVSLQEFGTTTEFKLGCMFATRFLRKRKNTKMESVKCYLCEDCGCNCISSCSILVCTLILPFSSTKSLVPA